MLRTVIIDVSPHCPEVTEEIVNPSLAGPEDDRQRQEDRATDHMKQNLC